MPRQDRLDAPGALHHVKENERVGQASQLRPQFRLHVVVFAECLVKTSGHHIKHVRIVIYQKDKNSKPAITFWQVRRLLAFVQRYS